MGLPPSLFTVADDPAPLAGMAFPPAGVDWAFLHEHGFRRVVRLEPGDYDPSPLAVEDIRLEDLAGGREPADPIAERDRVLQAARLAAADVRRGDGVVVHCRAGVGRTGAVLVCALLYLGRSEEEAIGAVGSQRPSWPEAPWQRQVVRSVLPG